MSGHTHIDFYSNVGFNEVWVEAEFDGDDELFDYSVKLIFKDGKTFDLPELDISDLYVKFDGAVVPVSGVIENEIIARGPRE